MEQLSFDVGFVSLVQGFQTIAPERTLTVLATQVPRVLGSFMVSHPAGFFWSVARMKSIRSSHCDLAVLDVSFSQTLKFGEFMMFSMAFFSSGDGIFEIFPEAPRGFQATRIIFPEPSLATVDIGAIVLSCVFVCF